MDPLALAAVVGLVFAGQRLSSDAPSSATTTPPPPQIRKVDTDLMADAPGRSSDSFGLRPINPDFGRRVADAYLPPKSAVANLQDMSPMANRFPFGQPVYDLYNRQNVTNKMNNLQPIERKNVGPGLGVSPNVPAIGGFQQFFRVLPNNVNEEKLVTLPGGKGPSNPVVKQGGTQLGASGFINGTMTHQAKVTKAWRRPPAQNQGQGQGGRLMAPEGRPDQIKMRKTTNRQELGKRGDALEFGPAQYNVYQHYSQLTDKQLPHSTGNRVNPDRAGNAGRMNVRADPQGQVGTATQLRAESVPVPVPHMNGSRFQNYLPAEMYKMNQSKSNENPLAAPKVLGLARDVLKQNPIAVPPLAVV
jgi:Family of unknown function (DUF5899)